MASIPIEEVTRDQLYTYLVRESVRAAWLGGDWYMHLCWARLCADLFAYPAIVPDKNLDGSHLLGRKMRVSEEYGIPELRRA